MAVQKLEGCDDRALVLEEDYLTSTRWGGETGRTLLVDLTPGNVVRKDKGKTLGVFGKKEERVMIDFDRLDLLIWVPLERQDEAESFVADANAKIANATA